MFPVKCDLENMTFCGRRNFLTKFGYWLKNKFAFVLYPYYIYMLKHLHFKSIDTLVSFVVGSSLKLIEAAQIVSEISELLRLLKKRKLRVILEIGTARGGTLFLFSKIIQPRGHLISIDLPYGNFGGGYPRMSIPLYNLFVSKNEKLDLIRGDSHNFHTFEIVKNLLNGKKIDFLFIDGDHTYSGVKKDFNLYFSLVKRGGLIAFHDIAHNSMDERVGVDKFWNEIIKKFKHKEIVESIDQNGFGIGLIYK